MAIGELSICLKLSNYMNLRKELNCNVKNYKLIEFRRVQRLEGLRVQRLESLKIGRFDDWRV